MALVLVGVLGVGVLWLGLRGRRINDHPICRQCRFDLSGVYPAAVTCPECGAGLKREGSVRRGARRRVGWAVAAGSLMILVPLPPVGVVTFAALTGSDVNKYKPLGLLLWEAGIADRARTDAIAGEVMNRVLAKSLSADQYQGVIERALDLQGDPKAAWSESWGDLVERARLDGVLKPEQDTRFARQAARLGARTRPAVHAGQALPVRIALDEARVASNTSRSVALSFLGAKVDGTPVEWVREEAARPGASPFRFSTLRLDTSDESNYLGTIPLQGSRLTGGAGLLAIFGTAGDPMLSLRLPEGMTPGRHRLEVELAVEDISAGNGMVSLTMINGRMLNPGGGPSRTVTLALDVDVVSPRTPLATPIAASEETTRQLTEALRPTEVTVSRLAASDDGTLPARITFGVKDLPVSVAYDVIVRSGGQEWTLGSFDNSDRGQPPGVAGQFMTTGFSIAVGGSMRSGRRSGSLADQREVSGTMGVPKADRVDVLLRPSAKAAGETLNLTAYYDGEIEFRDVPVVPDMFADPGGDLLRRLEEMRTRPIRPPGVTRPRRGGAG
jgi:hypothetical protein